MPRRQATRAQIERERESEIWGIQAEIYQLVEVVRRGHDIGKEVRERSKSGELKATFELLNFSVLMGEWVRIEEGRSEREAVFFNPQKLRPKISRFHMYVLANFDKARAASREKVEQRHLCFDEASSKLWVRGIPFRIRRISDQFDLLRVIFQDAAEVGKEWFFDEIAEKIDHAQQGKRLKKYYNAAHQIRLKLGAKGCPDFFFTTEHTTRINPMYFS